MVKLLLEKSKFRKFSFLIAVFAKAAMLKTVWYEPKDRNRLIQ
jgi:hypothetical protein